MVISTLFRNTEIDLVDCNDRMKDADVVEHLDLNEEELEAFHNLVVQCKNYIDHYNRIVEHSET